MKKGTFFKILSVVLAVMFIVLAFAGCKGKEYTKTDDPSESNTDGTTEPAYPANINPLTGLEMSESAAGKRPVAIMVENSPAARPQWGLSTPDIVIEGLVEGGITRMMWIYADVSQVPKVGPVRSARHDYVELAYGMNAVFAHWGGSKPAYSLLSSLASKGYLDVDGKFIGTNGNESQKGYYFFKDPTHSNATEHCGYTTGAYLAAAMESKKIDTAQTKEDWAPFTVITSGDRTPYGEATSGTCSSITVTFSSSYKHTFKYDAEKGLYLNFMNTSPMLDGNTKEQMAVKNVIVMYTNVTGYQTSNQGDQKLREWDLTGGDALYVSNGYGEKITWKKGDASSPLKFYGQDGKELTINRGQTWIGVIPNGNRELTQVAE
ncbi:MAG: DUF3048 domain-containing protein [Oscillospiraceae bacterium]|nr:DUF3048 domain-containing protein [Oscillospiraceae bacterium]